jgi:hypothetical protein
MAQENVDVLPVIAGEEGGTVVGLLSYKDIIAAFKYGIEEHRQMNPNISLKRKGMRILVKGQRVFKTGKE